MGGSVSHEKKSLVVAGFVLNTLDEIPLQYFNRQDQLTMLSLSVKV